MRIPWRLSVYRWSSRIWYATIVLVSPQSDRQVRRPCDYEIIEVGVLSRGLARPEQEQRPAFLGAWESRFFRWSVAEGREACGLLALREVTFLAGVLIPRVDELTSTTVERLRETPMQVAHPFSFAQRPSCPT
jgi:hypothetical protein